MSTVEEMYGPQHDAVETLITRVAALTADETKRLDATIALAWDTAWYTAWAVAVRTTLAVAVKHNRHIGMNTAVDATRGVAVDAVRALIVRDLITPDGVTQAHYDLLTGPWATVIGKVHPDDEATT